MPHPDIIRSKQKFDNLKLEYIRTPKIIWDKLIKEFEFTVDACASDKNALLPKYWTKEDSALDHSWDGEIVYCHPMFDNNIPKFVKKAIESKCVTVFLLPSSTNSVYFHKYFWDSLTNTPRNNIEVRFLPKPAGQHGLKFLTEDNVEPKFGYLKALMVVIVNNV